MEELEILFEEQTKAKKIGDYVKLNEINKKIFAIREEKRKQKKIERQKQNENAINKKIEEILTQ